MRSVPGRKFFLVKDTIVAFATAAENRDTTSLFLALTAGSPRGSDPARWSGEFGCACELDVMAILVTHARRGTARCNMSWYVRLSHQLRCKERFITEGETGNQCHCAGVPLFRCGRDYWGLRARNLTPGTR